jgi:transposase InsO family protein
MHVQEEIGEFQKALIYENKIGTVLPVIEVGNSIPGRRVVAVLERQAKTRGLPRIVRTDNGTEFISRAVETVRRGLTYVPDRRAG